MKIGLGIIFGSLRGEKEKKYFGGFFLRIGDGQVEEKRKWVILVFFWLNLVEVWLRNRGLKFFWGFGVGEAKKILLRDFIKNQRS